ncbi:DNA translocase FtsK [Candidatus Shapirobacteria bacterium CG03_land_8_20_14_0_80_39_12]|uniref:DNA translocase FtsK n=1 Tax=Candidatus Shapirobacteria bacterium CG03_land_8_20_14_0_80_39_12 TaxID=1974879 RepID=A0A2M7BDN9_9BACT|nr:MAG: DNA translocase FtsK [Candidatus Shapirobacteria bacterium CG03_land_8_20_14_0_80_39_12]
MARRRGWLKRRFRIKLKKEAAFSIGYILLFCLALLLILSFTRQGVVLYKLNTVLISIFGWGTIFVIFFLLLLGLMLTKFNVPWNQAAVLAGGGLMAVALMGVTKSGQVGKIIFEQIAYLITPVGTYIVLIGATLVGFVVLFNTSFDQIMATMIAPFQALSLGKNKGKPQFIQEKFANKSLLTKSDLTNRGREPAKVVTAAEVEEEELSAAAVNVPGAQADVWHYPPLSLLSDSQGGKADRGDVKTNASTIERTFDSFGISARVVEVNDGPAVTQYAIEVALGTKLTKITSLANDLALALAAPTGQIRVEAPIPGRSLVGIELPNRSLEVVVLKQILGSQPMKETKKKLLVPLGLDVSGQPKVVDIAKMPHVLIAGQTGSGKSVLLNSWVASFLFRTTPSEVRLILVDPKRVGFTEYNGIPHLLTPVIVEPREVIKALSWATREMDQRYKKFAQAGAHNIEQYNEISGFQALPYVVIIIDELADIILVNPAEVEDNICRIAQMARATGIHLIIATQHPSVDILTGLIKANFPARISFAVSSMTDSRVILDTPGAEKLLGRGDMLYIPPDQAKPTRIQGAFVSDGDITRLVEFIKQTGIRPVYTEEVTEGTETGGEYGRDSSGGRDPLYEEAVRITCQFGRASASLFQRRLSVGYTRAARIIDQMEASGVIGPADGAKPRDVLIKNADEFLSSKPGQIQN